MRWKYVPEKISMDGAWWKRLNGDPYKWLVFSGALPPESIEENYDQQQNRLLMAQKLPQLTVSQPVRGEYATAIKWISFEEVLRPPK
jgi:hypothetical protein